MESIASAYYSTFNYYRGSKRKHLAEGLLQRHVELSMHENPTDMLTKQLSQDKLELCEQLIGHQHS